MKAIKIAGIFLVSAGAFAQPQNAEIPKGAHVLLRMNNSVSSRTAHEDDFVYLTTASPIAVGGRILVPVNTHVNGVVARVQRSGRVHGRAQLAIRLETMTLNDGRIVKFTPKINSVDSDETGQRVEGPEGKVAQGGTKGRDVEQIAILAGSGAALGAMVGSRVSDSALRGAGIGAGAGTGVGIARALMTRGKEVELRHGSSIDVVFDRAVTLE
jgi:hypothetical protein